jgi:hypothetical protein
MKTVLPKHDDCDDSSHHILDWDKSNIDFVEWDLNEDIFKWNLKQLDVLYNLEDFVVDCDNRMSEIRAEAIRLDLHPLELNWVDGVGSMEELVYHKTEALTKINHIRERLPILYNTD